MLQNTVQNFFNIFFYLKEIYINNSVIFNLINNVIFIFLFLIIYFLFLNSKNICFLFLFILFIFYFLFTLYLTFLILKGKSKLTHIKYENITKNSEFIQFKNNLFKFYYSSIIVLSIYLFRSVNQTFVIYYLLEGLSTNILFILLLTLILIFIICTLLSNTYILFIFKTYLSIKNCIKTLNDINFFPTDIKFNNIKPVLFSQGYNSRSFSTYTNNNINEIENNNLDPDNLNSVNHNSDQSLKKQLKEFKKAYGGGYLGYTHIYNFGSVTQFTSYSSELEFEACRENLISKLKDYLYVIPETETYSILPVIRFEHSEKEYKSLSI